MIFIEWICTEHAFSVVGTQFIDFKSDTLIRCHSHNCTMHTLTSSHTKPNKVKQQIDLIEFKWECWWLFYTTMMSWHLLRWGEKHSKNSRATKSIKYISSPSSIELRTKQNWTKTNTHQKQRDRCAFTEPVTYQRSEWEYATRIRTHIKYDSNEIRQTWTRKKNVFVCIWMLGGFFHVSGVPLLKITKRCAYAFRALIICLNILNQIFKKPHIRTSKHIINKQIHKHN